MGEHRLPLHPGSRKEISSGISGWSCCEVPRKSCLRLCGLALDIKLTFAVRVTQSPLLCTYIAIRYGMESEERETADNWKFEAERGTPLEMSLHPWRRPLAPPRRVTGEHFDAGAAECEGSSWIQSPVLICAWAPEPSHAGHPGCGGRVTQCPCLWPFPPAGLALCDFGRRTSPLPERGRRPAADQPGADHHARQHASPRPWSTCGSRRTSGRLPRQAGSRQAGGISWPGPVPGYARLRRHSAFPQPPPTPRPILQ